MTTHALRLTRRPEPTAAVGAPSRFPSVGIALGLAGLLAVLAALVGNLVAAGDTGAQRAETLAWTFGLTTAGFATLKLGIATILMGVLVRLWLRVDSVKAALPALRPAAEPEGAARYGPIGTPYGPAVASPAALEPLPIHRLARRLWSPMLVLGAMLVAAGLALSFLQAGTSDAGDFLALGAWVQGLQFLGEALLLAGISFLLGSILAALRGGGGEVQEELGLTVKTLTMPRSAKLFVGLMMLGVVAAMAQFVLYAVAASLDDPSTWFAFLAPLREFALGLLLSGIVLALATIGTVLGFQFARIREIVVTGR